MKKIILLFSLLIFFFNNSYAISTVSELGLSVATATMDSKSIQTGLSNVAKDQTKEWLSSSVGGIEKMILQNSEAEIQDAIGKITEIADIVKAIEKIAIAIDAGNYDMAGIEAMDQLVGKVNHPLVSLTWSAVKLTYESHKLVISTENARQVEILYYIVNKDRMLLGVADPTSNTPPEIPINQDTADYFFNKYIMTNSEARGALKAYVTTVLGQDWPEQSYAEWLGSFRTIGMGLDSKKDAELEMLDKEWRNKGRTWVIAVIKEINKQARQNWAEVKLRQEIAAFQKFTQSVISFKQEDLPHMLKDFQEIQKYKKELPLYREELAKSMKLRSTKAQEVASLSKESFSNVIAQLVSLSTSWQRNMMAYESRASLLREEQLASKLYEESNGWRKIKDEVGNFLLSNGETAAKELASEEINKQYDYSVSIKESASVLERSAMAKAYSEQFISRQEYSIEPFSWEFKVEQVGSFYIPKDINMPSKPDDFSKELLKVLNKGEIRTAENMYTAYSMAAKESFVEYSYVMMRASMGYFEYPTPSDLPPYDDTKDNTAKNAGWRIAKTAVHVKAKVTYLVETEKYNRKIDSLNQMMETFKKLENERKAQWALYKEHIYKILTLGDYRIDLEEWQSKSNKCSENSYTKLNIVDNDIKYIVGVPGALNGYYVRKIKSPACFAPESLIELREVLKKRVDTVSQNLDEFTKLQPLTQKDINAISIFQWGKNTNEVTKMTKEIESYLWRIKETEKNIDKTRQVIPLIEKMIPVSKTDLLNRAKDITWLEDKAKDVEAFIAYLLNSGKLKRGHTEGFPEIEFALVLPKNIQIKNSMLISNDSPVHYLSANEINALAQPLISMYEGTSMQIFLNTYFPQVSKNLSNFLALKFINPAEENIIVMNKTVFASDLKNLEDMLKEINVKEDSFDKKIANIPVCFPSPVTFRNYYFEDRYIDKEELNKTVLGEKLLKLRAKVKELFVLRRSFLITEEQKLNKIKTDEEIKQRELEAEKKYLESLQEDETKVNTQIKAIESLYSKFSQYYSDKNIASLMSLISDDWESTGDGTTLMDLEETLDNSFSVFDEINCSIDNLNIYKLSTNKYQISYVIAIKGFIYENDIEHFEKSSVKEEVVIENNKAKISKTLNGNFWPSR